MISVAVTQDVGEAAALDLPPAIFNRIVLDTARERRCVLGPEKPQSVCDFRSADDTGAYTSSPRVESDSLMSCGSVARQLTADAPRSQLGLHLWVSLNGRLIRRCCRSGHCAL